MATSAQIIQFLLSQVAASGITLSGGQVFFFAAGTSTPKPVWIDRNKSTEAANPYTLDPNGTAQLYADGVYRMVIKDSNGAPRYDRDYLNFADHDLDLADLNSALAAKTFRNVSEYTDLAAAVAAIGSTPATLAYKTDQTLTANIAIPSTLELFPLDGAVIYHSAYTIDYLGSTARWPSAQVFNGTGAVSGLKRTMPEWFGTGQESAQLAINAAIEGGVLELPNKYALTTGLTISKPLTLQGPCGFTQAIDYVNNDMLTIDADGVTIDGVTFAGPVTTGNTNYNGKAAIVVKGGDISIRNCIITGKQLGIVGTDSVGDNVTVEGNKIRHSLGGIVLWSTSETSDPALKPKNLRVVGNDVALQAGFAPAAASPSSVGNDIRGIVCWNFNGLTIEGNRSVGAQIPIEVWWSTNFTIARNTVDMWLSTDTNTHGTISDNNIDYALRPAIAATFHASYGYGPGVGLEIVRSDRVVVTGNKIAKQPGNGIFTGYIGSLVSKTKCSNLTIEGNTLADCADNTGTYASMMLGGLVDSLVVNNTVLRSSAATGNSRSIFYGGLVTTASGYFSPAYNVVFRGNVVRGDRNTTAGGAVQIQHAKNVTLDSNTVEDCAASGVDVGQAVVYGLTLRGNALRNNAGYGLRFTVADSHEVYAENNDLRGNGLGAALAIGGTVSENVMLRNNMGLVHSGATPLKGTFEIGDLINISHATNKWLRCTVAGTMGTIASVTASTTNGSVAATVNNHGAMKLTTGQYVTIAGVSGVKQIRAMVPTYDANGYTGAAVTLSVAADATVTGAAVAYSAATVAQVL